MAFEDFKKPEAAQLIRQRARASAFAEVLAVPTLIPDRADGSRFSSGQHQFGSSHR